MLSDGLHDKFTIHSLTLWRAFESYDAKAHRTILKSKIWVPVMPLSDPRDVQTPQRLNLLTIAGDLL